MLSKINRLQRQLMVHSYIYYRLNDNIWSDEQWDKAAKELLSLDQTGSAYETLFKDFDGSTGYQLAQYVAMEGNLAYVAERLLAHEQRNKSV